MNARVAAVALIAATGCGHPGRSTTARYPSDRDATLLAVPGSALGDFGICTPGLVLVASDGGVVLAGTDHWTISTRGHDPVSAVDCDETGKMFMAIGSSIALADRVRGGDAVSLGTLAGRIHVTASIDTVAWIWTDLPRGRALLSKFDTANGLQQIAVVDQRIGAVAAAGTSAAVVAVGKDLLLFNGGETPTLLRHLDAVPDGLAVAGDGGVFVSLPGGIDHLGSDGTVTRVTEGVHGPLRLRHQTLYVLWRERRAVVRLAPKAEASGPLP